MRHTEDDLRAVLGSLERQAPGAAETLAGVRRLRRRRTTRRRVAGIAAVTVAVAAASLTAPELFRDQPPATTVRAADNWAFGFAIDDLPGIRTVFQGLGTPDKGERALVFGPDPHPYEVYVRPAGGYDPAGARTGEPVDVRGKSGFYRAQGPELAWEYAPDAWALVRYGAGEPAPGGVREKLLGIAAAVRFDRTTPLRVPFFIGSLPGGLKRDPATVGAWNTASAGGELLLAPALPGRAGLRISVLPYAGKDLPVGEPAGREQPGPVSLAEVNLGPFLVRLSSSGESRFSVAELVAVARSIGVVGNVDDPGTWVDAVRAVPVG